MKGALGPLVAATLGLMAGCTSHRESATSMVAELRNPSSRDAAIVDCSERLKVALTPDRRDIAATIMRVKPSRVPWTFCDRLASAVVRGDLTTDEFVDATSGHPSEATQARMMHALITPGLSEPAGKEPAPAS